MWEIIANGLHTGPITGSYFIAYSAFCSDYYVNLISIKYIQCLKQKSLLVLFDTEYEYFCILADVQVFLSLYT